MSGPAVDIGRMPREAPRESVRRNPEMLPLTPAQRVELDRRLDEIDRCETGTIPWEEDRRRLPDRAR